MGEQHPGTTPDGATEARSSSHIAALTKMVKAFVDEREWGQFHSPKNLAMALAGEVGELAAEFQWLTEGDSEEVRAPGPLRQRVKDEVADVAIYLLLLAERCNIDLAMAVAAKLESNEARYPVAASRGSAEKARLDAN